MAFPILGADFLAQNKMVVDLNNRQLVAGPLKIKLTAPRAGQQAGVGVVQQVGPHKAVSRCRKTSAHRDWTAAASSPAQQQGWAIALFGKERLALFLLKRAKERFALLRSF